MDTSEIIAAFLCGLGHWDGCNWPTQFGTEGLDLQGLRASQALLMARSTAGNERAAWRAAARWLEQVERDANVAAEEACLAADLAILGQFKRALDHADRACRMELQYKAGATWQPLRDAIAVHLGEMIGTNCARPLEQHRKAAESGSTLATNGQGSDSEIASRKTSPTATRNE